MTNIRVRFAPSPTGPLHIGGVRTALFNYLFARKHKGSFILRIEDTDQKRFDDRAESYIKESLDWLNLTPDESPWNPKQFGPYRQSERLDIYNDYIPTILESGYAYYAFDTPEELDEKRKEYESKGKVFSYNAETRDSMNNSLGMTPEELEAKMLTKPSYVIRFKMPADEDIMTDDIIRGKSVINTKDLDDKVLVKADGVPTYHFANVIDDYLMQISHVIRGEEWLPSLALHLMLYKAFDWNPPKFAHLPLILKPEGNGKLSKRDGAQLGFPVLPLTWRGKDETSLGFRELGYFPETMVNFLAGLGWTPQPENEVLALDVLAEQFDLEKVHKSGARFDIKKAQHMNKEVMHQTPVVAILPEYEQKLKDWDIDYSKINTEKILHLMKDRVEFLNDLVAESEFFYIAPMAFNETLLEKINKEGTAENLHHLHAKLQNADFNNAQKIHECIKEFTDEHNLNSSQVLMPLRVSLVGELKGPDIPDIMEILGKEESLRRIELLAKVLDSENNS